MTISRAIGTVVACTLVFASIGVVAGLGIGLVAPGYYRAVFRRGDEPAFDPLEVGIGLGLTQGVTAGALIGIVLVAILAWQHRRN